MYIKKNICRDILLGVAVGDALGVPVEFKSREAIAENPVTDMIGYELTIFRKVPFRMIVPWLFVWLRH